ncbi:hypothetical protein MKZ38_008859 [Zalerion maritima]|uniref:Uncharacterized protein n=1 Tax=Zalerion maritima TaxID=339359 RepID=A0AAD5WMJ1_9PEZI|nr:hypothetical protein MKZ38_008859 [Zalerion maritima]
MNALSSSSLLPILTLLTLALTPLTAAFAANCLKSDSQCLFALSSFKVPPPGGSGSEGNFDFPVGTVLRESEIYDQDCNIIGGAVPAKSSDWKEGKRINTKLGPKLDIHASGDLGITPRGMKYNYGGHDYEMQTDKSCYECSETRDGVVGLCCLEWFDC